MRKNEVEKAEGNIRACVGIAFVLFVIGIMAFIQAGEEILQIL